jgi:2-polyprenyl-3-methyl-5-hydroxy-6-metoxy-1,4-benzoquinol methylase
MNYTDQQHFFMRSRMWGAASVIVLFSLAGWCSKIYGTRTSPTLLAFALTMLALAGSIYYTPDYLGLTVKSFKKSKWETRIRWRVIAAVFVVGIFAAVHGGGVRGLLLAVAWLIGANLLAKAAVPARYFPVWFWATDFALVAGLAFRTRSDLLLVTGFLAAAAHLSIVICEEYPFVWAGVVAISGCLLIFTSSSLRGVLHDSASLASLFLSSALATSWLLHRAEGRNLENIGTAMRELFDFTGYPTERIRHLWSVSDQELAKNWQIARLDEHDRDRMAEWYRENSELYMFAISAYNLEYKRIRSNLRMFKFARGSCLDYGAGNGELILELARRGHSAAYYDVDGQTMKFARLRAQRQSLAVEFLHTKEQLAAVRAPHGFDTIFSFDVLEHLPDLPGELDFLVSLLNPGGKLIFDVPAGSTKSHPMHLNHNLNVRAHLLAKGLKEVRSLSQSINFRKEEKYVFCAPLSLRDPAGGPPFPIRVSSN